MEHTNAQGRKQSVDRQNVRMMRRRTKRCKRGRRWGREGVQKYRRWRFGVGGGYSCESITPNANEEITYLYISNKLFTRSTHLCVHALSDHCLLKREEGTNLPGKKGCQ